MKGTSKEPKLKAKTMTVADTMPGMICGRVTCQKVCHRPAPSVAAASSLSRPSPISTE
jgi:ubiquitin C-terminal hydrolase